MMSISEWSDTIIVAELEDEPELSDDLAGLIDRLQRNEDQPNVVLNFDQVTYLNSSNLAQLLDLRRALEGGESILRLCGVVESVMSLFELTGLHKIFEFQENTAMALAMLQIDGEGGEVEDDLLDPEV